MDRAFTELRQAICDPGERADVMPAELRDFATSSVVALAVGGESSRFRTVAGAPGVNKNATRLPTGDTMVEMTIRMYREAGFKDFIALVSHRAESIMEVLGDGGRLDVRVTYSHDPGGPVGRGGAIRHAVENGSIARTKNLIVHNPDDVIVDYPGSFPHELVAAHVAGTRKGMIATAVMAEGLRATYTGMCVQHGVITEVIPYPLVPVPAHVGVTVFSPAVYDAFVGLFDLSRKSDFEAVLFPFLVERGQLYSFFIPTEHWHQVNDPKAWDKLIATLMPAER